jgi:hypothetical protein
MNFFCVYIKINKLEVSNETINKELETLKQQSNGLTDLQRDFNRLDMVYVKCLMQTNTARIDFLDFAQENSIHL